MTQKDCNIIELFMDQVHVQHLKSHQLLPNLRRYVSTLYSSRRTSHSFFIFSSDALFQSFISTKSLRDEKEIRMSRYFYDDYINFTFRSVRNYPFKGKVECMESYFFKKEANGDYTLRGYLSNHNNHRKFIPKELSCYKAHIFYRVGLPLEDVEHDEDIVFSAPIYIE